MDIICPRCGEAWDMDCLHEEAAARYQQQYDQEFSVAYKGDPEKAKQEYDGIFREVSSEWRSIGCGAMKSIRGTDEPCERQRSMRTAMASAAYELMGDDIDGAASFMEDMRT